MRHLCRTTAIALAMGGLAFGAHAQETDSEQASAGAGYCDLAWTSVDQDGNGFVSKDEASGSMQARFDSIDADGSGRLAYTEFADCISARSGMEAARADRTDESFREADADRDEAISREEFRDLARLSYDNVQERQVTGVDAEPVVILRRYVWLTPQEAGDPRTYGDMSQDEAAARSAYTFNSLDQNDDDMVGIAEWKQSSSGRTGTDRDLRARFESFDSDANDEISREEYEAAQSDMVDDLSTSSTNAGDDASSTDDSDEATAADSSEIPVYFYHFGIR